MEKKIEKVIYNKLSSLPDNKAVLYADLQVAFSSATGEELSNHLNTLQIVADKLEGEGFARFEKLPNGMPRVLRGIDFDKWCQTMSVDSSTSRININSLEATNVQVGNKNVLNVNASSEDLVKAISTLIANPKKAESTLEKLKGYVKQGISIGELVKKIIALSG